MRKIACIGAGSFVFTRAIFRDLLTFPAFHDCEIALMDINPDRLERITAACRKIREAMGRPECTITSTLDRAEALDGADGVQRFRFITVPLLAPTTLFLFVTTFIASMKVFQSVDVMTGGGPGTATNVMVQWIYNLTFKDFHTARGAAVSLVFFVILLV